MATKTATGIFSDGSTFTLSVTDAVSPPPPPAGWSLSVAPFAATSLWNKLIPAGATYTSLSWPTSTGWSYGVTWDRTGVPVYIASSSDPVVAVSCPATWGWPANPSLHVPVGATGSPGGGSPPDNPIVVVDGDTVWNFWRFVRTSNTAATAGAYGKSSVTVGTGFGASGVGAGITGAGSSQLGGLLVQAQTDTGTITHALALAVASQLLLPGHIAPAIGGDGSSSTGIVEEGQLLAIPANTVMPSGLSVLGQEVFRALQQYGAYVIDNAGSQTTVLRAQFNAYNATIMGALNTDMIKIIPLLRKVS